MKKYLFILTFVPLLITPRAKAQLEIGGTTLDTTTIIQGLDTPWEILWGPEGNIWFTERYGRVSKLNPETGKHDMLLQIEDLVHEQSEAGMLGMALDPDFETNRRVYLVYNYLEESRIKERLVRYEYNGQALINGETLLEDIGGSGNHNGARIAFGPDGKIYLSTGDAVNTSLSQDPESLNGKVLRINPDGSIPDDNPDPESYIWTLGHRNPQGLVFSPDNILYSSEHGPANDDELNIIEKGRNYGWPQVHGFCDAVSEEEFCLLNDVKEPLIAWTPTLAVAGIDYYGHDAIPEWQHSILMTTLKADRLVAMNLSEDGLSVLNDEHHLIDWWGRLRDVCVSSDGRVFIASSNRDGRGDVRVGDDRIVELAAVKSTNLEEYSLPAVYPNPVRDGFIFIEKSWNSSILSVRLFDSLGRLISHKDFKNPDNSIRMNLDINAGIYYLQLTDGAEVQMIQVVIQ